MGVSFPLHLWHGYTLTISTFLSSAKHCILTGQTECLGKHQDLEDGYSDRKTTLEVVRENHSLSTGSSCLTSADNQVEATLSGFPGSVKMGETKFWTLELGVGISSLFCVWPLFTTARTVQLAGPCWKHDLLVPL